MSKGLIWHSIPKTPNYISGCGQYVAKYQRTVKGGYYSVFKLVWVESLRRRVKETVAVVGSLPDSYQAFWGMVFTKERDV